MTGKKSDKTIERPPVVVIMGHIDHGKSSLLDYIRHSNIVAKEAGGITQHLGAYEIEHKTADGKSKKITFLDTPGHAAFMGIRSRSTKIADIAILIISAEDGVKPQTLEALDCIKKDNRNFIIAINKIDSPKANVEKTKNDLVENEIYVEGYGGQTPVVEISAKTGAGINDLLDLIVLSSEVEGLTANPEATAEGFIIEAHKDRNRGLSATLVIKNGTLYSGQFVSCRKAFSPIRIFEDHNYKHIKSATVSSPVHISGWSDFPEVGASFKTFNSKKEAESYCTECRKEDAEKELAENLRKKSEADFAEKNDNDVLVVPIIIKSDTHGSIEAVELELERMPTTNSKIKIVASGTGNISEADVKTASSNENSIIVGFGIEVDRQARIMGERLNIPIRTFDVIYDLVEWLTSEIEEMRPRILVDEVRGNAKILKSFSRNKSTSVLGGRVLTGKINLKSEVKILRRGEEIGRGIIKELQSQKTKVGDVSEGNEFGLALESRVEVVPGDEIETFEQVKK